MSNSWLIVPGFLSKESSFFRALTRHHIFSSFRQGKSEMSPTIGPEIVASPHSLSPRGRNALPLRRSVHRTSQEITDDILTATRSPSRSSSTSIEFDETAGDVVRVEGLKHSFDRLDARRYKTEAFAGQLLTILRNIKVPHWTAVELSASSVKIQKVSGSLTNAVFFVSYPSIPSPPILLLRIYGPSSGNMISRPRELHVLHVLSSQYHIGPKVYGTFENGRVEEHFDSIALTPPEMRDPQVSSWIGARMAELHQVDIGTVEGSTEWEIAAKKNVRAWLHPAREVLALPSVSDFIRKDLDLDSFQAEWERYMTWLDSQEKQFGASRRVFAHNDTQYGNLLRLNNPKPGLPEHRRIIVVDFEYAAPNTAAFDIANHFHEWTANYHSDTPHLLDAARYPTQEQRFNFYQSYITHYGSSIPSDSDDCGSLDDQMTVLDRQVQLWSPSSHAMYAVWGVVQAREAIEGDGDGEFDYIGYARCRMEGFRRELRALMS